MRWQLRLAPSRCRVLCAWPTTENGYGVNLIQAYAYPRTLEIALELNLQGVFSASDRFSNQANHAESLKGSLSPEPSISF